MKMYLSKVIQSVLFPLTTILTEEETFDWQVVCRVDTKDLLGQWTMCPQMSKRGKWFWGEKVLVTQFACHKKEIEFQMIKRKVQVLSTSMSFAGSSDFGVSLFDRWTFFFFCQRSFHFQSQTTSSRNRFKLGHNKDQVEWRKVKIDQK